MREKSQSCLTAAIGLANFSSPSQPKYFTLKSRLKLTSTRNNLIIWN